MDHQLKTHCPNCFKPSNTAVCVACHFDREAYLQHQAAAHHLPLFTVLDKGYVIGRVLGEGCFAIVYAAIREKDQLACAVKEYYPRDLAQRGLDNKSVKPKHNQEHLLRWQKRFVEEAELLRSCYDHPSVESGVVRYTALLNAHNTVYLVMERLSGITLRAYLAEHKKLSPEQIFPWLMPLLETLQKLHAKEIYHRDISSSNIFLTATNKPVLMDFGLAREGAQDELLKSSTLGAGTFIAPEQLAGGHCDQRTDLYAVGAVIYLCLHGENPPPIEARRQGAALKTLNSGDKPSQALQTGMAHCLQLNVNLRPKNVAHLLEELGSVALNKPVVQAAALETIIPRRRYPEPAVERAKPQPTNPYLRPTLAKPRSVWRSLGLFFGIVLALIGLAYGGFMFYQKYDLNESEQRKQDNLLFSQAQSLEDYKAYLKSCITCENQQRAMERIAQLTVEQQALLAQQKQQEQEALLFGKAITAADFKLYLSSCVQCADKAKAEEKLAQLNAESKLADEAQLVAQATEIADALKTKGSSTEFYKESCPTNLAFWQRTAEQGHAVAQLLLGSCYRSGDGVKQDYAESLKWYRKSAEQGNVHAQANLAAMYKNGFGTAKNDAEAGKWYRKAAEQGQANAQYVLGMMYETGEGVTQDYKQSVDWYLRAAEQGNADAEYSLGTLYHYGSGVTQDYQAALLWYRKSAQQGNDKAEYLLGVMYQNGYGVESDDAQALSWYKKAAKQGNADALGQVNMLEAAAKTPETFSAEVLKY